MKPKATSAQGHKKPAKPTKPNQRKKWDIPKCKNKNLVFKRTCFKKNDIHMVTMIGKMKSQEKVPCVISLKAGFIITKTKSSDLLHQSLEIWCSAQLLQCNTGMNCVRGGDMVKCVHGTALMERWTDNTICSRKRFDVPARKWRIACSWMQLMSWIIWEQTIWLATR